MALASILLPDAFLPPLVWRRRYETCQTSFRALDSAPPGVLSLWQSLESTRTSKQLDHIRPMPSNTKTLILGVRDSLPCGQDLL
jgi:hypothetical protein